MGTSKSTQSTVIDISIVACTNVLLVAFDRQVVQTLNTEMGARLPDSLDDVDFYEIGSPLTFAHYYNAKEGAFYGLDNDMKRFEPRTFFLRLRPEVPEVNGLYLSGQDVICDGLGPSMLGGLLCARKVLGITNPTSLVK